MGGASAGFTISLTFQFATNIFFVTPQVVSFTFRTIDGLIRLHFHNFAFREKSWMFVFERVFRLCKIKERDPKMEIDPAVQKNKIDFHRERFSCLVNATGFAYQCQNVSENINLRLSTGQRFSARFKHKAPQSYRRINLC